MEDLGGGPGAGAGVGQVELPDIALQVACIHVHQGLAVGCVDAGGREQGIAGGAVGGNFLDHRARLQVEDDQHGLVVGAVGTITQHDRRGAGAIAHHAHDRRADHIPHIAGAGAFPFDVTGGERGRRGHIQRVHALAATAEGTHQIVLAGDVGIRRDHHRPIDEELVLIVATAQERQIGEVDDVRYVGEQFLAIGGIEGVQHAVVGAHVQGLGRRLIGRRRVHDVAQHGGDA